LYPLSKITSATAICLDCEDRAAPLGTGLHREFFCPQYSDTALAKIKTQSQPHISISVRDQALGGPTVKFLAAALVLHIMSRVQLREFMALFVVGWALTLAVFFLALLLLPFETFTPFPFPRFPGFF